MDRYLMLHAKPCVFQQSVSGRDFLFFGVDAEKELEILPSFSDHSIRQGLVLCPSFSLSPRFNSVFLRLLIRAGYPVGARFYTT